MLSSSEAGEAFAMLPDTGRVVYLELYGGDAWGRDRRCRPAAAPAPALCGLDFCAEDVAGRTLGADCARFFDPLPAVRKPRLPAATANF